MRFVIDLDTYWEYLVYLSRSLDYYALFFVTAIFAACAYCAGFALRLVADKRIRYSVLHLLPFVPICAAMFVTAYVEHIVFAEKFPAIGDAIFYPIGELCVITVLYTAFYYFSRGKNTAPSVEATPLRPPENRVGDASYKRAVYPVVMKEAPDFDAGDGAVDFAGAYEFLSGLIDGGKDSDAVKKLKSEISFFEGVEMTDGVKKRLNGLFFEAVRLSREN